MYPGSYLLYTEKRQQAMVPLIDQQCFAIHHCKAFYLDYYTQHQMTYCKNIWTDSVLTELVPFVNRLDIQDVYKLRRYGKCRQKLWITKQTKYIRTDWTIEIVGAYNGYVYRARVLITKIKLMYIEIIALLRMEKVSVEMEKQRNCWNDLSCNWWQKGQQLYVILEIRSGHRYCYVS